MRDASAKRRGHDNPCGTSASRTVHSRCRCALQIGRGEILMPAYSNTFTPNSISRGDLQSVWVTGDGNLVSGTKTQRVALAELPNGAAKKLSMQVIFSGAPGVISLQPQTSDTDNDADYQ